MRWSPPFKTMLLFSFWTLLVCASFVPSLYFNHVLTEEMLEDGRNATLRQLDFIHWLIGESMTFNSVDELQKWLSEIGRELGLRVTFVATNGKVLADSQIPALEIGNLENYLTRPEIVQTLDSDTGLITRYSDVVKKPQFFAARRVPARGGLPPGIVRVGNDLSPMQDRVDRLKNTFLLLFFLVFLGTLFVSYLLLRQLRAPIASLIEATRRLAIGDYSNRIHFRPGHEFYPMAEAFNEMAEEVGRYVQDISDQKQQMEAVFNGMLEGVLVLDSRGKIVTINRALAQLVSHPLQSIGRRPMEVFVNLELQAACDRIVSPRGESEETETSLQVVLGRDRTYDVNIVRLRDLHGNAGAIVVFHDISQLKRLEKVRQDFVANVSHELRTPLTSIKGYAETLLGEDRGPEGVIVPFLEVILKNANHMVKMVDDLLQLARLESPAKSVQLLPVDAGETLANAWKACVPLAEEKSIRLENFLPRTAVRVMADFDQLVQVFRNLLENAVKYSPQGSAIAVGCQVIESTVAFSVRDQGAGIPRQYHQRIFERFYRIEKDRSAHPGSTGLGLAISRHIVLNHGGSIWVQSPNSDGSKGTTFFFTLSRVADSEDSPVPHDGPKEAIGVEGGKS